jgi:glycosyltransferase involved in cell wall biosynthesis
MLVHLPHSRLVIAGSTHDPYANLIERRAAELGLANRVQLVGRVSDEERLWLYQQCEALVFPSLAEGFGLPLIEAMHCGRPVFSSRCTSLPEVGGSLAVYWDNFDPEGMAATVRDGLRRIAADPAYTDQLRAWSRQFTWPRTAERYLELYRDALSARESGFCPAA